MAEILETRRLINQSIKQFNQSINQSSARFSYGTGGSVLPYDCRHRVGIVLGLWCHRVGTARLPHPGLALPEPGCLTPRPPLYTLRLVSSSYILRTPPPL